MVDFKNNKNSAQRLRCIWNHRK